MSLTTSGDNLERFYVIMLPVRLNPPSTAAIGGPESFFLVGQNY